MNDDVIDPARVGAALAALRDLVAADARREACAARCRTALAGLSGTERDWIHGAAREAAERQAGDGR